MYMRGLADGEYDEYGDYIPSNAPSQAAPDTAWSMPAMTSPVNNVAAPSSGTNWSALLQTGLSTYKTKMQIDAANAARTAAYGGYQPYATGYPYAPGSSPFPGVMGSSLSGVLPLLLLAGAGIFLLKR